MPISGDACTEAEIADLLNERGVRTVSMQPFTRHRVTRLRSAYTLKHRRTRLRDAGLLMPSDISARYGVSLSTVHEWRRRGLLRAHPVNDKGEYLYEIPSQNLPGKFQHKGDYQEKCRTSHSNDVRGAV